MEQSPETGAPPGQVRSAASVVAFALAACLALATAEALCSVDRIDAFAFLALVLATYTAPLMVGGAVVAMLVATPLRTDPRILVVLSALGAVVALSAPPLPFLPSPRGVLAAAAVATLLVALWRVGAHEISPWLLLAVPFPTCLAVVAAESRGLGPAGALGGPTAVAVLASLAIRGPRRYRGLVATVLVVGTAGIALWARPRAWPTDRSTSDTVREARGPRIVFIVFDTARRDRFGCYGYSHPTTPVLDAFAARAVRYDDHVSAGSWTLPSHAALLSGRLASRHGVGRLVQVPTREITRWLPGALRERGYATAAIVANGVALHPGGPVQQGFDEWQTSRRYHRQALLSRYSPRLPDLDLFAPVFQTQQVYRDAGEIARAAADWVKDRGAKGPYFLLVNFMDTHEPYGGRGGERASFGEQRPEGTYGLPSVDEWQIRLGRRAITVAEKRRVDALYDQSVHYLDHEVGALLRAIDGVDPDTWVFVTSDHGQSLGDEGRFGHDSLHEEILRVPLFVRYPRGSGPAPGVVRSPTSSLDLVATITRALDLQLGALDGEPLGERRGPRLAWGYEDSPRADGSAETREGFVVYDGGLKYVQLAGGEERLYDLRHGETTLGAAEHEGDLRRLRDLSPRPSPPLAQGRDLSDLQTGLDDEVLRSLGYVGGSR